MEAGDKTIAIRDAGTMKRLKLMRDGTYAEVVTLEMTLDPSEHIQEHLDLANSGANRAAHALEHAAMGVQNTNGGITDFARPNGAAPTTTASGIAVAYRSNGAPVTYSAGFLSSSAGSGNRAWYGEFNLGKAVTRLGAEFKFTAGSGGATGAITLCPWGGSVTAAAHTPPTGLHLTISRWGWGAAKILSIDGAVTTYASGAFKTALAADTIYTIDCAIDVVNSIAYLRLPDGTIATVSDPAIASIAGSWAGWEFYQNNGATDDIVSIGRVWSGSSDALLHQAAALAAFDVPIKPTAVGLTSVASNSFPTAAALLDSAAVCPVPYGKTDKRVLCRITMWVTAAASRSIILAPLFRNASGSILSQPFLYLLTAPAAGYNGWATLEFVWNVTGTQQVTCELWGNSTGAGDTMTVSATKPLTVSFFPLG